MAGNTSTFSSMLSKDNPPNFCASGDGDLYARATKRKMGGLIKRVIKDSSGTSIASPDAAGMYGLSQCGRQKQGLPRFTVEDGKFDQVVHKNVKPVRNAETPQAHKTDIFEELEKRLEAQKPQEPNEADPWEIQEASFAQQNAFLDKKKALLDYTYSSSASNDEALERKYPEFKQWSHEIMEQNAKLRAGHGTIAGVRRKIVDAALAVP